MFSLTAASRFAAVPEHLADWVANGRAAVLPQPLAEELANHVPCLAWSSSTSLDWEQLNGERFAVGDLSHPSVLAWLRSRRISGYEQAAVLLGRGLALAVPVDACVRHFAELTWHNGPGRHFACGLSAEDGERMKLNVDALLEYGGNTLAGN